MSWPRWPGERSLQFAITGPWALGMESVRFPVDGWTKVMEAES